MNTLNHDHSLSHGPHSHPVSLLSQAVSASDRELLHALELHEDIQLLAFHKWEAAGRPGGGGVPFWLEAETELKKKADSWGRGNSQDADRHSGIRHPHSLKM
jgi:hypothetical protein